MNKLQWQGDPVKTKFGYCNVSENKEKNLWWYNFECNEDVILQGVAAIPAIEVTYGNQKFCIANHFGIGYHKLIHGGWPNYSHFSLPDDGFVEDHHSEFNIHKFDLEGYEQHEAERRKWQKQQFPEEFEKMERLRVCFENKFNDKKL